MGRGGKTTRAAGTRYAVDLPKNTVPRSLLSRWPQWPVWTSQSRALQREATEDTPGWELAGCGVGADLNCPEA